MSDAERFALKTVAVTGGARGIGRAIATTLMRHGMTVAIADIDAQAVAETAEQLGSSVHAYALDVTDADAFERFVDQVESDLGPLDVLVNNAGIMPAGAFLEEASESTRRQWEINIGGVVNGTRAFLPRAIKRGRGHLINTSSVAGLTGYAGIATYSGTKFYVYGFSEALRTELRGTGVNISVVIPGFVQTELTAGIGDARFFRRITPDEVAAGVATTIVRPRFEVCVPKMLGPMNLITRMLPRSMGDAMLRWARADRLALDYDHSARAAYEARAAASAPVIHALEATQGSQDADRTELTARDSALICLALTEPRARATSAPASVAVIERIRGDVYRIAVPTPWMVSVNCYLLVGEPLTLIDAGPGLTASTAALWQAMVSIGHEPDSIELLVATHHHFDHIGAMGQLARRSRAKVACFDGATWLMENWDTHRRQDDDWLASQMLRHGVPPATVASVRMFAELESHLAEPLAITCPLADGAVLAAGGRELHVHHRPGHSVSDILLHDPRDGLLFTGDHLLETVSSNALMSLPLTGGDLASQRDPALKIYRGSLALTRLLPEGRVLPGHGASFYGHHALIDQRIAEQSRRAERFLDRLAAGPRSAFSLAQESFGATADAQVFLVLSEVLGHLDLMADGCVTEHRDGTTWFELA